jgi:hypothetical protein
MLNLARLELLGTPQVSPGKLPQASSDRYTTALPRESHAVEDKESQQSFLLNDCSASACQACALQGRFISLRRPEE